MQKNETLLLTIDDLSTEGQAIAHHEGMAIFLDGALPGETVRAKIIALKKNYAVGKLEEVVTPSPQRVQPPCPVFSRCGGCTLQHLEYAGQLQYKHAHVQNCMQRIAKLDVPVLFPLPARQPYHYRNKASFPVQMDVAPLIGFYARHSHKLVDLEDCLIQQGEMRLLLAQLRVFLTKYAIAVYDEATHKGLLRHILVRTNAAGHIMLVFVLNGKELPHQKELGVLLTLVLPQIKSIMVNVNTKKGNQILGNSSYCIYGRDHIYETIDDLEFKIGAQSFLQVNTPQTALLYHTLLDLLHLNSTDTVLDLYCGAGTISLFLARHCKQVYGIEIVPQAVENASFNAALNGIENAQFLEGDVDNVLPKLLREQAPTAIVVDPPRKGLSEALIATIAQTGVPKIGYVSCNPSTLARDLALFAQSGYLPELIQPVDMFPQTTHVESIVLLTKAQK